MTSFAYRWVASAFAAMISFSIVACKPDMDRESGVQRETSAPSSLATETVKPPQADRRPIEITQHGYTRTDPYAWLKDSSWERVLQDPDALDPEIRAHLKAENAYYKQATAHLAGLQTDLFREMRGRIPVNEETTPAPFGDYAYWRRFREDGQHPVFMRRPRDGGKETVLVDGDKEAPGQSYFKISTVVPSPSQALVAYGVDNTGSESFRIRIRDIETGADLPEVEARTTGAIVWASDSKSFFYVERDGKQRPKRVKRHVLGSASEDDELIYEEPDDQLFLTIQKSQSGEYLFLWSGNRVVSEARYVPLSAPATKPAVIVPRAENVLYYPEHRGDEFFLLTNEGGAVDFKIVAASIAQIGSNAWREVVPHRPGRYIYGAVAYHDFMVRLERIDATPRLVVFDYAEAEFEIDFPDPAYHIQFDPGYEFETSSIRFRYQSPAQPEQTFDFDVGAKTRTLLKTQRIPSGHDPAEYVVETLTAEAADGAFVPVTTLRRKSTEMDGTAPLLLFGYGSYGRYVPDKFSAHVLSLVDRGAVYAIAHVRGGGAKGRQWYLDGKLGKKMNTFTDFIAAADALIGRGYTSAGKIVIRGGSAGGLLVGAAVNLRPDLFAGVVAEKPFVDVLNTMSEPSLTLTPTEWSEWGDPVSSEAAYRWIASYAPYENIRADETYPPILATAGLTDFQVTYWEPAKWIARLRAEARVGPFLLQTNMSAGHGGAGARFDKVEEEAHVYAFILDAMGLNAVAR